MTKRYPFSVQKHARDIEFYKNHFYRKLNEMENDPSVPAEKYNRFLEFSHKIISLEIALKHGRKIVYLTGEQIGLAKKIVLWSAEHRYLVNRNDKVMK